MENQYNELSELWAGRLSLDTEFSYIFPIDLIIRPLGSPAEDDYAKRRES